MANWRVLLGVLASLVFVTFLYSFQLNSLTGGLSKAESAYIQDNTYVQNIVEKPIFLLHKVLSFFASALDSSGSFARIPSVFLMILCLTCFYALVARWYTTRVALLTTLLLVTSSWTLTIGRQALPTTMYLGWLPVLALLYWTIARSKQSLGLILWVLSFGLALYVPGLLWFVIILAASQRKRLVSLVQNAAVLQLIVSIACLLLLVVPYVFVLFQSPSTAVASLGLPTSVAQITSMPERLYRLILQIFVFSAGNPVFQLGHLPYLDVSSSILFFLGLYRLRYSRERKMLALSGVVASGWFIGVGLGAINLAIFLPLIYMFIGGGISFLLIQWFKVFPNNPVARVIGLVLMSSLVVVISFYHLTRYFIAWPMNPETRAAFSSTNVKIDKK